MYKVSYATLRYRKFGTQRRGILLEDNFCSCFVQKDHDISVKYHSAYFKKYMITQSLIFNSKEFEIKMYF